MSISSPDNRRYLIQCMVAHRQILDVAMIAGQHDGGALQIEFAQRTTNKSRQQRQPRSRRVSILSMSNFVSQEVFVKSESISGDNVSEHGAGLFRRTQLDIFAALDQETVREIMKNGTAGSQVIDHIKRHASSFDCRRGRRNPTWPTFKKLLCISVRERDSINPTLF